MVYPTLNETKKKYHEKQAEYFNKTHKMIKEAIPVGSTVMTLNKNKEYKLQPNYEGPFKVVKVTKGGMHMLQDQAGQVLKRNYQIAELKLVADAPYNFGQSEPMARIIKHRGEADNWEYLVLWADKNKSTTWEPASNIDDMVTITQYWRSTNTKYKVGESFILIKINMKWNNNKDNIGAC